MTRKHFQRIADGIRYQAEDPANDPGTVAKMAHEIAAACSTFNPNFDRDRFLTACGIQ